MTAARRDLIRRTAEQAIEERRQAGELEKQRVRAGQNESLEQLKQFRDASC